MEKQMSYDDMVNLVMLAIFVLIAGMVLWKASGILNRGRSKPKQSTFFKNNMKDKYDRM